MSVTGTGFRAPRGLVQWDCGDFFTVDSATQITATVPASATTGTIAVTTPGGTATSAAPFTRGFAGHEHHGHRAERHRSLVAVGPADAGLDGLCEPGGRSSQFGVWLIDQADASKWYFAGFFSGRAGQTIYTPSFSPLGIPAGHLQGRGLLPHRPRPPWVWQANAHEPRGGARSPPRRSRSPSPCPNGTEVWPLVGHRRRLGWTVSPAGRSAASSASG